MEIRSRFEMKVKETRGEGRYVGPGARHDRPDKSAWHFRHSVSVLQNLVTLTA